MVDFTNADQADQTYGQERSAQAKRFRQSASELEAAQRILSGLENRRNNTIILIEMRRHKLAQALRLASDKVINQQANALARSQVTANANKSD